MWARALVGTSVFLLLVAAACGRTYDSDDRAVDAGSKPTSDAAPDAISDATSGTSPDGSSPGIDAGPHCEPRAPFTKVDRVLGIPDGAYCARFSPDESIVSFTVPGNETHQATRGPDGAYGVATKIEFAASNATCAHFSADRKIVYFEDFFAVWVESGPPGGPYAAKTPVDRGDAANIGVPFFDEAHQVLYVDYHLTPSQYFINAALGTTRITGGTTEPMRRLDVGFGLDGGEGPRDASTPSEYKFSAPTPTADGLAIYFGTIAKPDGGHDVGNADIYVSTRQDLTTDFSNPAPVEGVDSDHTETPSWISPDSCRLYFHSNRNHPGSLSTEVFVATRTP